MKKYWLDIVFMLVIFTLALVLRIVIAQPTFNGDLSFPAGDDDDYYQIAISLIVGLSPPGFATLIVAVFFLAGIQLITIGVIGEYVGRIFEEVKGRPLYVVRRVWGRE